VVTGSNQGPSVKQQTPDVILFAQAYDGEGELFNGGVSVENLQLPELASRITDVRARAVAKTLNTNHNFGTFLNKQFCFIFLLL
jgi:hypothetical protein